MYGSCKRGRVILVVRDVAKKDLTNEKFYVIVLMDAKAFSLREEFQEEKRMKKTLRKIGAIAGLMTIMMGTLAGCGKKKCDICEEKKKCSKQEYFGETVYVCDDCKSALERFGL